MHRKENTREAACTTICILAAVLVVFVIVVFVDVVVGDVVVGGIVIVIIIVIIIVIVIVADFVAVTGIGFGNNIGNVIVIEIVDVSVASLDLVEIANCRPARFSRKRK